MSRHKSDWSDLYPELVFAIATRLETLDDYRHFRSVCQNWRSFSPINENLPIFSPLFPHKFSTTPPPLANIDDESHIRRHGYSLSIVANSTFLIKPKNPNPNLNRKPLKPWLITVEEITPGRLILRKPLTRLVIEEFPENFPKFLNLSDCEVTEIRRDYNYRYAEESVYVGYRRWWRFYDKVILFFNPYSSSHSVDDCYALILHDRGDLLFVRLNDVNEFGFLRCSRVSKFDDIVIYKGGVWAIDRRGRSYVICYRNDLKLTMVSSECVCAGYVGDTRKRLVESSEGLYMIDRYHEDELIKFRVYKLNEEEYKWNEIRSLGGRILFVLSDCCFFGAAEDLPGCGRNCIYFPKDHFPAYYGSNHPDDFYFKGASKELEVGVFHLNDDESGLVSTFPGYSGLLWPPPKWILPGWDGEEEDTTAESSLNIDVSDSYASDDLEQSETGTTHIQLQGADVPWTDIPSKLLTDIAKCLKSRNDICQFRAVCKDWRASSSPPPHSNLLCSLFPYKISRNLALFINHINRFPEANSSLSLVASTVYLVQPSGQSLIPSKSWLVTVEELNPGKLLLRLPLRRTAIKELPENFPKVLGLSDFRVTEIAREYNFRNANDTRRVFSSIDYSYLHGVDKVVLLSNSVPTPPTIDGTIAFVLCAKGCLVSLQLGSNSRNDWWFVRHGPVTNFDDVLNFKGQIYAIDRKGRVYVITYYAHKISRITKDAMGTGKGADRHKRLVEFHGELYLLVRYSPDDKIYFKVYKLNEEQHKWDEVSSLGHNLLFVTRSVCFFASARDCPGWKGNCIVFPADCLPSYSGSTYPDWRFFRRTITELEIGVFHLGQADGAKLIKFYPGYSDLFWPPPAWLQPQENSLRNETDSSCYLTEEEEEEEKTPNLLGLLDKQNVENSFFISQQDIAAQMSTDSDPNAPISLPFQASDSVVSTIDFKGVKVKANLVPVLRKIWAKYGNVAEGMGSCDSSIATKAYESLAEAVQALITTTGRSLEQLQAVQMTLTLLSLQSMQFRVDWLVPFVENAVLCVRRKCLLIDLKELENMKAEVQNGRKELLEMEHNLDERTRALKQKINSLGPIDLDQCLGEYIC